MNNCTVVVVVVVSVVVVVVVISVIVALVDVKPCVWKAWLRIVAMTTAHGHLEWRSLLGEALKTAQIDALI